jgi:methyltransferase
MHINHYFLFLFLFLILQRFVELWLARRNGKWVISQGGYEVGKSHFKYIVFIHIGFLVSLFMEVGAGAKPPTWWMFPCIILILSQFLRYWCIYSLGPYWNTRIYIVPESGLVKKGPYRWFSHPNYLVVITEFVVIPLIFGAYWTAVFWSVINFVFLTIVRIPVEEKALEVAHFNSRNINE